MTVEMKPLPNDLIDALLADYKKPEDLIGQNGLLKQLTKALVERALQAELTDHLGHGKNQLVANEAGNTRNGRSKKTLKGDFGELPIEIPRDRAGTFEPQIITKHQTRWSGFDDKILSLYARGMTVREIQSHLQEMYGAEVSPTLISSVTDAVMDEVKAWQSRPLDALYPIVYMDCIHVKVRDNGAVRVKALYLAIGVNLDGLKEVLGLWMAQTEGAKFWLQVVTVPVFSGQAVAGNTTSASQAVSVIKISCTTRCSRLASAWRAWFKSGSLIAGFSPMMYMPRTLCGSVSGARALCMISTTV